MSGDSGGFEPVPFPTIDPLIWMPISANLWRQHEASDGTYDVEDLVDVVEFLQTKDRNQALLAEWRERNAGN